MSTVDATAGESGAPAPAAPEAAPAPAVIGPLAGDPSIWGLGSFIAGSVALGLGLVGVVPFGVLGAPLAIIVAATSLGLLLSAIWSAAIGQSAANYPALTAAGAIHNIAVATVGNLTGGSLMVGAVYWFVYLRPSRL